MRVGVILRGDGSGTRELKLRHICHFKGFAVDVRGVDGNAAEALQRHDPSSGLWRRRDDGTVHGALITGCGGGRAHYRQLSSDLKHPRSRPDVRAAVNLGLLLPHWATHGSRMELRLLTCVAGDTTTNTSLPPSPISARCSTRASLCTNGLNELGFSLSARREIPIDQETHRGSRQKRASSPK